MSLTEILIAMGLMTLGLLGVMSIFPVGSHYMVQAEIADQGSAVGQAVMNDLVARGMLDPNTWRMCAVVGPYATGETANTYSRQVGPAIEAWKQSTITPWVLSQRAGSVYVIDPMAVAVTTVPPGVAQNRLVSPFPGEAYLLNTSAVYGSCTAWDPWKVASDYWPIRRVTFLQANTGSRMEAPLAWSLFSSSSDLVTEANTSEINGRLYICRHSCADQRRSSKCDCDWRVRL
jgi:hypothetical protein